MLVRKNKTQKETYLTLIKSKNVQEMTDAYQLLKALLNERIIKQHFYQWRRNPEQIVAAKLVKILNRAINPTPTEYIGDPIRSIFCELIKDFSLFTANSRLLALISAFFSIYSHLVVNLSPPLKTKFQLHDELEQRSYAYISSCLKHGKKEKNLFLAIRTLPAKNPLSKEIEVFLIAQWQDLLSARYFLQDEMERFLALNHFISKEQLSILIANVLQTVQGSNEKIKPALTILFELKEILLPVHWERILKVFWKKIKIGLPNKKLLAVENFVLAVSRYISDEIKKTFIKREFCETAFNQQASYVCSYMTDSLLNLRGFIPKTVYPWIIERTMEMFELEDCKWQIIAMEMLLIVQEEISSTQKKILTDKLHNFLENNNAEVNIVLPKLAKLKSFVKHHPEYVDRFFIRNKQVIINGLMDETTVNSVIALIDFLSEQNETDLIDSFFHGIRNNPAASQIFLITTLIKYISFISLANRGRVINELTRIVAVDMSGCFQFEGIKLVDCLLALAKQVDAAQYALLVDLAVCLAKFDPNNDIPLRLISGLDNFIQEIKWHQLIDKMVTRHLKVKSLFFVCYRSYIPESKWPHIINQLFLALHNSDTNYMREELSETLWKLKDIVSIYHQGEIHFNILFTLFLNVDLPINKFLVSLTIALRSVIPKQIWDEFISKLMTKLINGSLNLTWEIASLLTVDHSISEQMITPFVDQLIDDMNNLARKKPKDNFIKNELDRFTDTLFLLSHFLKNKKGILNDSLAKHMIGRFYHLLQYDSDLKEKQQYLHFFDSLKYFLSDTQWIRLLDSLSNVAYAGEKGKALHVLVHAKRFLSRGNWEKIIKDFIAELDKPFIIEADKNSLIFKRLRFLAKINSVVSKEIRQLIIQKLIKLLDHINSCYLALRVLYYHVNDMNQDTKVAILWKLSNLQNDHFLHQYFAAEAKLFLAVYASYKTSAAYSLLGKINVNSFFSDRNENQPIYLPPEILCRIMPRS